jgi:UDPglucose 6-dehydrogenase
LATKISFANAIAKLSEIVGANGPEVLTAVGLDSRIGSKFLYAGAGYGGSCFPKDVKALIAIADGYGYDFALLKNVEKINKEAIHAIVTKTEKLLENKLKGKTIGIFGLSFKPDTDDMRDAPSILVIKELLKKGAHIKAYDPIAMQNAKKLLPAHVIYGNNALEVAIDADCVVVMTEWNEFRQLDLTDLKKHMKQANLVDGRNIYNPQKAKKLGFSYVGVGR